MITFENTKEGLDIEYTKGDTFVFNFESENDIAEGSSLRLQISPNGNTNDILIEKKFDVSNNIFTIKLTENEISRLNIGEVYQHRFTLYDISNNRTTTISGNLIVKWGA